jgi:Tfp pilus assembly protein PilE
MKNKKWFTFVELIVTISIVIILSSLWIVSYSSYIWDARDSQRKSDMAQVSSALKIYKQKRWYYGFPGDLFNITYSWTTVAMQWRLNENVHLDTIEKLPSDPKNDEYYFYSIINNKQEFEITWTLENSKDNIALKMGTYKSVSRNILPTITLAIWATAWSNVEIQAWNWDWDENRKLFIYDNQNYNLPYTFIAPFEPYSEWLSFDTLIDEVELYWDFWQNTDYRNCTEIDEAWKLIIPLSATSFEYQIITNTWALVNTGCTL